MRRKLLGRFTTTLGFTALKSALLVTAVTFSVIARAETPAERTAEEISANVLSPFCPGRLLKDCPSSSASELKQEILSRAEKGESKDAIVNSLYEKFGDELRAVPARTGFGSLAWFTPFLFVGVGALLIFRWLRKSRAKSLETALPPETTMSPEMRERVERELSK